MHINIFGLAILMVGSRLITNNHLQIHMAIRKRGLTDALIKHRI